jgi:hypothetical protein
VYQLIFLAQCKAALRAASVEAAKKCPVPASTMADYEACGVPGQKAGRRPQYTTGVRLVMRASVKLHGATMVPYRAGEWGRNASLYLICRDGAGRGFQCGRGERGFCFGFRFRHLVQLRRGGFTLVWRFMEQWRTELEGALKKGLEDSDEEFEENLMQELFQLLLDETSSSSKTSKIGGSTLGRRYVHRDREACDERLYHDYFTEDCTFDALKFRRYFRMRRDLFLHIVEKVCAFDPWFIQKCDGVGRLGLSSLQKCTAAISMLAYGIPANAKDEYCRTGESTTIEAMNASLLPFRGALSPIF